MSQRKIPHFFSATKNENEAKTKCGLPQALYEEVINIGSPPSGTRRPLTIVQRARLQRCVMAQRRHVRLLTGDLEYVADSLAEVNPRSQQRQRQQEQHSRMVLRLAEANENLGRLVHLVERDDDDRDFFMAHKAQREEVADFEARQQQCKSEAVSIKQRVPDPAVPSTSAQAMARQRNNKRTSSAMQEEEAGGVMPSPLIIPESPIPHPSTPVGSRRARSRLQRTLTPSSRRCTRGTTSKSSSSSDTGVVTRLSKRNKKLYAKLNERIESEAATAEAAAANDGPRAPRRTRPNVTFSVLPQQQDQNQQQARPQQQRREPPQQVEVQPVQAADRQPRRRRQNSASYGDGLEARLQFFERSTLNRPVAREYQLVCDHNCAFFNDNGHCEHAVVNVSGTVAVKCPQLCYDFYVTSRCSHLQIDLGEGFRNVFAQPQPVTIVRPDVAQIGHYFDEITPIIPQPLTPVPREEANPEPNPEVKQEEVKPEVKTEE